MIEPAIAAILLGTSSITTIVGARIAPVEEAQGNAETAHIVYQVTGAENLDCLEAAATHINEEFQVDVFAPTMAACKALAALVRTALHFYDGTAGGVTVDKIIHNNTTDLTPPADVGQAKPLFRLSLEFRALLH